MATTLAERPASVVAAPLTDPAITLARITAGQIMTRPAGTIDADESLWQAALRLAGGNHRQLVVLHHRRPVGVLDDRILTQEWPCGPLAARRRTVGQIMPGRVHTVLPHVTAARVAAIMLEDGTDAVPVVDPRGQVLGLVTDRHLIALLARLEGTTR